MDQVLEQIISAIEPMDLAKTAECYQRLASLTIRQDSKLSYLAGRIAGVQGTLHPEKLQKAVVVFAADHAVDGGENKTNGKNSKADALEIATGRGPINKVAHRIGAGVMLLDMGLEEDIPESQGVQDLKVMHGSHFWARQDAMSEDDDCLSCAAITARAAELAACQQVETKENSNGSIVRKTYGVGGAREQARAGFPTAKRVLSCYDEYRQRGFFTPWLAGLLTAMAELDDNNALKRGGSSGAELVKKRAVELLSLGSGLTIDLLEAFDDELIALNISCGGSADLLACAMLLDKLGKKQLL